MRKHTLLILFLCVAIIGILLALFAILNTKSVITDDEIIKISNNSHEFKTLVINPPTEYNFLSKDEIYKIRKDYVKKSLFSSKKYEPKEENFASMVSKKAWMGLVSCYDLEHQGNYEGYIKGASKVSNEVNNPNMLVSPVLAFFPWNTAENQGFCNQYYSNFIPTSIDYSKKSKLIKTTYDVEPDFPKYKIKLQGETYPILLALTGLNARDFGYNYAYILDSKNIKMLYSEDNTQLNVKEFLNKLYFDSKCKYEGGCNNLSLGQTEMLFSVAGLPAEITLKLWKDKPENQTSVADIYYRLAFQRKN